MRVKKPLTAQDVEAVRAELILARIELRYIQQHLDRVNTTIETKLQAEPAPELPSSLATLQDRTP